MDDKHGVSQINSITAPCTTGKKSIGQFGISNGAMLLEMQVGALDHFVFLNDQMVTLQQQVS